MIKNFTWVDTVNSELREQISLAISLGIHIPEFIKIVSSDEMEKVMMNPDTIIRGNYAFKKTMGCKVGFAAFFNGEKFVNYTGMIKESFKFAGNQGPELDHNILMSYGIDQQKSAKYFKKLAAIIRENDDGFLGFVQINTFVDLDGDWWFDDITFGAQLDLIYNYTNLVGAEGEVDFSQPIFFKNRYAASLRLFPHDWPDSPIAHVKSDSEAFEDVWELFYNTYENCFMCHSTGDVIKDVWKRLYHKCSGIERFNYLYRIDGGEVCRARFHDVKKYDLV